MGTRQRDMSCSTGRCSVVASMLIVSTVLLSSLAGGTTPVQERLAAKELLDEVGGVYEANEQNKPRTLSTESTELNFWLQHGNLASLLGMQPISHAHMKVPLHLIFIGFEGDGNQGFDMSEVALKPWFEHLDEAIPHTIVPSVTDFETTHEINSTIVEFKYDFKVWSLDPAVRLLIEQLIDQQHLKEDPAPLYPGAPAQAPRYIEAWRMQHILDSLASFMGLDSSYTIFVLNPHSPADCQQEPCYGYRSGLASSAMHTLETESDVKSLTDDYFSKWYAATKSNVYSTTDTHPDGKQQEKKSLWPKPDSKKQYWDVEKQYGSLKKASKAWATLHAKEVLDKAVLDHSFKADEAAELYNNLIRDAHLLEGDEWVRAMEEMSYLRLRSSKDFGQHGDCLVDNWAGRGRTSFIDLTAGPFQWGPLVGGEGVRANRTLPRIPKLPPSEAHTHAQNAQADYHKAEVEAKEAKQKAAKAQQELEDMLQLHKPAVAAAPKPKPAAPKPAAVQKPKPKPAVQKPPKPVVDDEARRRRIAPAAAKPKPAAPKPKPAAAPKPKPAAARKPAAPKPKPAAAKPKPSRPKPARPAQKPNPAYVDHTYNTKPDENKPKPNPAYVDHTYRKPKPAGTKPNRRLLAVDDEDLMDDDDDMWEENHKLGGSEEEVPKLSDVSIKEIEALQDMFVKAHCEDTDKLNPKQLSHCAEIADMMEAVMEAQGHAQDSLDKRSSEFDEPNLDTTATPDGLLAQLAASLHTTIHHLITPSSSKLPTLFPHRVFYHLYVINVDNSPPVDFHSYYNEFKRELLKLQLPSQEFAFSLHRLSMAEDTELALAYANALHSATVPSLSIDGVFTPATRMYLDSASLQHNLKVLGNQNGVYSRFEKHPEDEGKGPMHSSPYANSQEVPIFLFYQDQKKYPVLIDIHHQSKALDDMVIAVRSEGTWESVFACNGRPVVLNLENPLKPLLSATISHLAGVIPSHLTYSEAHRRTSQDWLWSVGDNPLAWSTSRWHFSQLQVDTVHRNYVIGVLEVSDARMRAGFSTLSSLKLTASNFKVLVSSAGSIKQLLKLWTAYYTSQRGVLDMAAKLDFHHTTMKLPKLEAITIEFESSTTKLKKAFSAFDCVTTGPEDSGKSGLLTNFQKLGFLILAAGVALCLLVRGSKPTKTKPKIN